jgi:hypothetical protein
MDHVCMGRLIYHIDLVENDDIGKLDLVHHEVRHGAIVLGGGVVATIREEVIGVKVVHHSKSIDNCDSGVEFGKLFHAASLIAREQLALCNRGRMDHGAYTSLRMRMDSSSRPGAPSIEPMSIICWAKRSSNVSETCSGSLMPLLSMIM